MIEGVSENYSNNNELFLILMQTFQILQFNRIRHQMFINIVQIKFKVI